MSQSFLQASEKSAAQECIFCSSLKSPSVVSQATPFKMGADFLQWVWHVF